MTLSVGPVLEVAASIVDSAGTTVPLAGQVFYILENDPADILRGNDLTSEIVYARTTNALRILAIRSFSTDSQGKAEIKQLKSGVYYICGISHTRQKAVVWNARIDLLPGRNELKLDHGNAGLFKD